MARRSTGEFAERLNDLVYEYVGKLSIAEVVGTLVITANEIQRAAEEVEEDRGDDWKNGGMGIGGE